MTLNKALVLLGISILFLLTVDKITNSSSIKLADAQESSKEYFFDKQILVEENIFTKFLYTMRNQVASVFSSNDETILLPIKFKMQENKLTCEIASLRMSLNYLGVNVTEDELVNNLQFSATGPRSLINEWGDPQKGFVGDINGSIFFGTGYGVYNQPIKNLALKYRDAVIIENPSLANLLEHAENGNPVIVWGLLNSKYSTYWAAYDGSLVKAFPGEHARIVMGYTGDISNPSNIILMDPLYGKVVMSTQRFLKEWQMLDKMSVVIL